MENQANMGYYLIKQHEMVYHFGATYTIYLFALVKCLSTFGKQNKTTDNQTQTQSARLRI